MFDEIYYAYGNTPIKGIHVFHLFRQDVSVLSNNKVQHNKLFVVVRLASEISVLMKCQNMLENLIKTLAGGK